MKRKMIELVLYEVFIVTIFLLWYILFWRFWPDKMRESPLNYFFSVAVAAASLAVVKWKESAAPAALCATWLGSVLLVWKALSYFSAGPMFSMLAITIVPIIPAALPLGYYTVRIAQEKELPDHWVSRSLCVTLLVFAIGCFLLIQWADRNYGLN